MSKEEAKRPAPEVLDPEELVLLVETCAHMAAGLSRKAAEKAAAAQLESNTNGG